MQGRRDIAKVRNLFAREESARDVVEGLAQSAGRYLIARPYAQLSAGCQQGVGRYFCKLRVVCGVYKHAENDRFCCGMLTGWDPLSFASVHVFKMK